MVLSRNNYLRFILCMFHTKKFRNLLEICVLLEFERISNVLHDAITYTENESKCNCYGERTIHK